MRTLDEVRHVLDLKKNHISLSTFNLKGYEYTGKGGVLKVSKSTRVVMKEQKMSQLYVL